MAYIRYINGKGGVINKDKALAIWNVLQGNAVPTPAQEKFCLTVKKIYLNKYTAPDDYLKSIKEYY